MIKLREKGRILKLKTGYNPNSSSIGSQIPAFLTFACGSGVLGVIIQNMIDAADKRLKNKGGKQKPESSQDASST